MRRSCSPSRSRRALCARFAVWLGTGLLASAPAFSQTPAAALPAAQVERHGDWEFVCMGADQPCVARQEQSSETGERLLLVEIGRGQGVALSGTALLPFGLLLDGGVVLRVDDGVSPQALSFRTCIPAGCLVAFEIDDAMRRSLQAGTTLTIGVRSLAGEAVLLPVSLTGFTAAAAGLDRDQ